MVRKMLYALRSGYFEPEVVPVVVGELSRAVVENPAHSRYIETGLACPLVGRGCVSDTSVEKAMLMIRSIKPVFSYLVSALCQGSGSFAAILPTEPPPSQAPAALILQMIADLAGQPARLVKLNKSLALHRLLVIFISSNSAFYVIVPCLEILERCLSTPGMDSFQRSFEAEGGFALLARTLGSCWRDDIQDCVFRMMLGLQKDKRDKDKDTLACPSLVSTVLSALDFLLQSAGEDETRPMVGRTQSGTVTTMRSVAMTPLVIKTDLPPDGEGTMSRLESLLRKMTSTYLESQAFKRCMTGRKVEQMLPALTDFAAVSASSSRTELAKAQRSAASEWLQALQTHAKISSTLITQIKLIVEQLRSAPASSKLSSSSFAMSPTSPRPNTAYFGSSLGNRLGTTPPASPGLGTSLGGFPRRRPSTDAGSFPGLGLRRMSTIEKRTPLKRVLTGESILEGGRDKNAAWKLIIIQTDAQSHSKMTLERKEHWQKISEVDWPRLASILRAENGLWPDDFGTVTWKLDGSEGPLRMRWA